MARRTRSACLTILAIVMVGLATHWCIASLSAAFVQPRAPKDADVAIVPAGMGALAALTASLPAEALPKGPFPGPLAGSAICTSKPLVWFIYPLCDWIFLLSPLYLAPVLLAIYAVFITILNLLIPATQPDEDLR
eukprot:CAMPEP_0117494234 /NCGR_PEP_ID=MMETSP0784-20121206/19506_1 /TAXON_ID=39447 /ORGANISM="" /LENGTH=134 /DNA_ID=CAMNT_0005289107 /DNA_START=79 /DNA_END=483 /DNA_ORIENTATION=-